MKLSDKFSNEYHAFWSRAFEFGYIFLVSETNYDGDPGQVQFFTITNRDETRQQLRITFGDASAEDSVWFVADQGGNMFGTLEPVMGDQDTGLFMCLRREETKLMQEHFNQSEFLDWSPSSLADTVAELNYTFVP